MSRIDSSHWKELSPLLDEVLELAGEARAVWLEALRATRPAAAAELKALLAELQSLDEAGFLQGDPTTVEKLRQVLHKLAGT
jgi:hypothetical protein